MFIKAITYGGLDWHDSSTSVEQVSYDGNFNIKQEDVKKAIAEHIIKCYPFLSKNMVRNCVKRSTQFKVPCMQKETNAKGKSVYKMPESTLFECANGKKMLCHESELSWSPRTKTLHYSTWWGQATFNTRYYVEDIPLEDVCYVAQENFLAVGKGVDIVQRTYWEPFKTYEEAIMALETLPIRPDTFPQYERVVSVERYSKFMNTKAAQNNMKANALMKEKEKTPYDEDFRIYVKDHIKHLMEI